MAEGAPIGLVRLLLVDDEAEPLHGLVRLLHRAYGPAMRLDAVADPMGALRRAAVHRYDVVLSDLRMPGLDGLGLLRRLSVWQPHASRILTASATDLARASRAAESAGIYRCVAKPWREADLLAHVGDALALALDQRGRAGPARLRSRAEASELGRLEASRPMPFDPVEPRRGVR